ANCFSDYFGEGAEMRTRGACAPQIITSAAESIHPGDVLANDQGVYVVCAFVSVDALEIHEMPDYGIAIGNSNGAQYVPRFARALKGHPDIVTLSQRNLLGARRARFHHAGEAQREQLRLRYFQHH